MDQQVTVSKFTEKSTLLSFEVTRTSLFKRKDATILNFSDKFAMYRHSNIEMHQFWDMVRQWMTEYTIVIDRLAFACNTKAQLTQPIWLYNSPEFISDTIVPSDNRLVSTPIEGFKYQMDWINVDFQLSIASIVKTNLKSVSPFLLMFNIKRVIGKTVGKAYSGFGGADSAHMPYEY